MHIPDGFLSPEVWIPSAAISLAVSAWASRQVRVELEPEKIPLMGVMGAFVFAAQMINFPVAGGTSGHLVGALLLAVLLGPHAAVLIMATVLTVQCLLFQDGGLTALGANILNMGIVPAYGGWVIYASLGKLLPASKSARQLAIALSAWLGVFFGSLLAGLELGLSGIVSTGTALLAMGSVHALIGLGEAAISVMVVNFLYKMRPDLLLKQSRI